MCQPLGGLRAQAAARSLTMSPPHSNHFTFPESWALLWGSQSLFPSSFCLVTRRPFHYRDMDPSDPEASCSCHIWVFLSCYPPSAASHVTTKSLCLLLGPLRTCRNVFQVAFVPSKVGCPGLSTVELSSCWQQRESPETLGVGGGGGFWLLLILAWDCWRNTFACSLGPRCAVSGCLEGDTVHRLPGKGAASRCP